MKSKWLYWVAIGFMAIGLGWAVDSCSTKSKELEAAKAKYNEASKLNTELQSQLDGQIASSLEVIKARNERIARLEAEASALSSQVGQLTNALSQANEPPTTAEQEALPIVQFLRARDRMQEERFSLAMADNLKDHQVIDELRGIIVAKDIAIDGWKKKYEGEYQLRIMSEDLGAKKDARIKRLERGFSLKSVAVGAAVATATYLILK